jgi:integrase
VYISLDEILQIARMPVGLQDLVMQRDQAAAVMLYLSGMRAGAFASAPIQAFDLDKRLVYQWPKEYCVKTKNGKKAITYLLPIPELLEVVIRWNEVASSNLPPTARWCPPIKNEWGAQEFSHEVAGVHRSTALNKRLKIVFKAAKLPYKSAHKFRHGHAVYGRENANDMSAYKAVSMNLMHEDIRTTDRIYASMRNDEVGSQIATMTRNEALPVKIGQTHYFENLSKKELAILLRALSDGKDE